MPDLPPPLSGLRFRHYRGEEEFAAFTAVYNAARLADGVSGLESVEEFTNHYRHLTNCDLDRDLIVVETDDGRVVGYARATWWVEEATGDRVLYWMMYLHPEARGRGAAEVVIDWLERRLIEIAAEHPHPGNQYLTSGLDQGEDEREKVLQAAGYERTQTFAEMIRLLSEPIPDLPLPEGVAVRPTTWDDGRAVWEADDRAFRDHVGYSAQTETDYERWRASRFADPSLWKVAFHGEAPVGMVLNYINAEENQAMGRSWGYTESISVQREWRRRGIAQALIAESMRMFRDMGFEHAALGVHTTNPNGAFPLYEGLGYKVIKLGWELRKPLPPG
jgi:ribosomal protein S18 acetylase RimI-like enzyme